MPNGPWVRLNPPGLACGPLGIRKIEEKWNIYLLRKYQPILVEQISDDSYILCDGERRVRAARMAGLTEIPALIISSKENDGSISRLLKALVANLQRSDLNPLEEAQTYKRLMDAENLSVRALSIT